MAKNRANRSNERRKDRGAEAAESTSAPARNSHWKTIAVLAIGGVAIAGAVVFEMERSKPSAVVPMPRGPAIPPAPMIQSEGTAQSTPQPPGEVPAGKVWSAEHGHWHDAATGQAPQ